jgi:hypothetical protein
LEISSGLWLGDAIIRDMPTVPESQFRGKGFGTPTPASPKSSSKHASNAFGSWSVGVQKIAWRWMWNFGEEIRQVNDVGKGMGANLAGCMSKSVSGSVCVNEGLKRSLPKDQRMAYIDWNGDMVGFLVGPVSLQVPRYLNFDKASVSGTAKPFYTEFGLFQATEGKSQTFGDDEEEISLPELCCSKISRVYNFEGRLKQGCTSFYTFQRFGMDETE